MFQIVSSFPNIYLSQGSVAMRLRCSGIFNDWFITFTAESDGERILKISQRRCPVFLTHG